MPTRKIKVVRIIARLNVGGPAYHVSLLSGKLDTSRYDTLLVAGALGRGEGSFEELANRYGAKLVTLPWLGPEISPIRDVRALVALVRILKQYRPDIVHTHTAKAGTVGRLAARIALGTSVRVIHTYHGHVLSGYFGPVTTALYRTIERGLARISDVLVGVSSATVEELVAMHIARRDRFRTIRLGLDLTRFLDLDDTTRAETRRSLGVADGEILATFVGRLVPIKRVDVLLDAVAIARAEGAPLKLAIVGDGEERVALEERAARMGPDAVAFLGFRQDLATLAAATDIAVLSSDNEGTPVALIEAAAAGKPSVATDVGGVGDIVGPDTGRLVAPGDAVGMARALRDLCSDPALRARMGAAARERVKRAYSSDRLLDDIDALYVELLSPGRA